MGKRGWKKKGPRGKEGRTKGDSTTSTELGVLQSKKSCKRLKEDNPRKRNRNEEENKKGAEQEEARNKSKKTGRNEQTS